MATKKLGLALAVVALIALPAVPAMAGTCPKDSPCGGQMPTDPSPSSPATPEVPTATPTPAPVPSSEPDPDPTEVPVPETDPVTAPPVEVGPDEEPTGSSDDAGKPAVQLPSGDGGNGNGNSGNGSGSTSGTSSSGGWSQPQSYPTPNTVRVGKATKKEKTSPPLSSPTPVQPAVTPSGESGPPWFVWAALIGTAGYGVYYFWRTRKDNSGVLDEDDTESSPTEEIPVAGKQ